MKIKAEYIGCVFKITDHGILKFYYNYKIMDHSNYNTRYTTIIRHLDLNITKSNPT